MQFMTHKDHGAHNAPDGEVETLKARGWIISTTEQWLASKFPAVAVAAVVLDVAKKRGPKPKGL